MKQNVNTRRIGGSVRNYLGIQAPVFYGFPRMIKGEQWNEPVHLSAV
jgi:hypothetical protein